MGICYRLFRGVLFRLEAERAHNLACSLGRTACGMGGFPLFFRSLVLPDLTRLKTPFLGSHLAHPIGLAAGFDKNAQMHDLAYAMGFSFTEVGSVTNGSSLGNRPPRCFRLPLDEALINRMGLNNFGAEVVEGTLIRYKGSFPYAVNIAKTNDPRLVGDAAIRDYCAAYARLSSFGMYTVLNVSCPNTAEGRTFEETAALNDLIFAIQETRRTCPGSKPLFLKLSPDLERDHLERLLSIAENRAIWGYVIGNTSLSRAGLKTHADDIDHIGRGGLSGAPLRMRTRALVQLVRSMVSRGKEIIAVGGVSSGEDVYQLLHSGANLVELYTALVYQGPGVVGKICRELLELMDRDGFDSISHIQGR